MLKNFKISNEVYDFLKWFIIIFMPSFCVLVSALGGHFKFEYTESVVFTLNTITMFLGAVVGISDKNKEL